MIEELEAKRESKEFETMRMNLQNAMIDYLNLHIPYHKNNFGLMIKTMMGLNETIKGIQRLKEEYNPDTDFGKYISDLFE